MRLDPRHTSQVIFWRPLAWPGMEQLFIEQDDERYVVDGMILALINDVPSRAWYHAHLSSDWRFERLWLQHTSEMPFAEGSFGVERGSRELWVDDDGSWRHRGFEQVPDLTGCIDIDIAVTPFTNTLPIRRLQLLEEGQSAEIAVAWIHIPELTIENARQRYTLLERTSTGARYRFEGLSSGFQADLDVDADGLVIDYPGLWERVR
jgi:hypothetical protein